MKLRWKELFVAIFVPLAVGGISALITGDAMSSFSSLEKPPLSPPPWLFPAVWTVLYTLMGISAARIWYSEPGPMRSKGLNLFIAQLVVNFFWSIIFFNLQAFELAFLWLLLLWGLVLWMILTFRKVDPVAALLQIPYLIWLTAAAYLSAGVWLLNG